MNEFVEKQLKFNEVNPDDCIECNWDCIVTCLTFKVTFKIGALYKYNIVYAEPASDKCAHLGTLRIEFIIDGQRYDFTPCTDEEAYVKWKEIIEKGNKPFSNEFEETMDI